MSAAPPYRAQWESAALIPAFLGGADPRGDPLWPASGAADAEEYALWCEHLCGCACLQMLLGARGRPIPPIHEVRRAVQRHGGYVETGDGGIRGLIYAGAIAWLAEQGIAARTRIDITADDIAREVAGGALFIASVHPAIRRPDPDPPSRGGHLVLVFGVAPDGALRFHNPSGDSAATRIDARLPPAAFARFFAGRGILVG